MKPSCYVSYQTASNPWTCTEIVDGSSDPVWCHENDCRLSSDLLTSGNSVCCICCQLLLFTCLFSHVNPFSWLLLGFLPPLVLEQNLWDKCTGFLYCPVEPTGVNCGKILIQQTSQVSGGQTGIWLQRLTPQSDNQVLTSLDDSGLS